MVRTLSVLTNYQLPPFFSFWTAYILLRTLDKNAIQCNNFGFVRHPKCREKDLLFLLLQQKPLWTRIDSSTIGRHTVVDDVFFPPPSIQFSTGIRYI
jgi:hypothetical protein